MPADADNNQNGNKSRTMRGQFPEKYFFMEGEVFWDCRLTKVRPQAKYVGNGGLENVTAMVGPVMSGSLPGGAKPSGPEGEGKEKGGKKRVTKKQGGFLQKLFIP